MYLLKRAAAVFVAVALLMTSVMVVSAAVWTDQEDYTPGSVVTISGDNSNFADGEGYLPGETVDVAVSGPNGWSASCSAEVGEDGSWSCQVTLDPDPDVAVGDYTYTATGQESGTTESGTFTDSHPSCVLELDSTALRTVQYSDYLVVTGVLKAGSLSNPCASAANITDSIASKTIYLDVSLNGDGDYDDAGELGVASGTTANAAGVTSEQVSHGSGTVTVYSAAYTIQWQVNLLPGGGTNQCTPGDDTCYRWRVRFVGSGSGGSATITNQHHRLKVTKEETTTTYDGDTNGTEGGSLNLSADVADLDGGIGAGNGVFSPDANLASTVANTNGVGYELWDTAGCTETSVAGPVFDDLDSNGEATGASMSLAGVTAGTYYLKTSYLGNSYYNSSSDCDSITVEADSVDYYVEFLPPLVGSTGIDDATVNMGKLGRVIPVKVNVYEGIDNTGDKITPDDELDIQILIENGYGACGNGYGAGDPVEAYASSSSANADDYFRWTPDSEDTGFWIYNLSTKNSQTFQKDKCYKITVIVDDPSDGEVEATEEYALLVLK